MKASNFAAIICVSVCPIWSPFTEIVWLTISK